MALAYKIKKTAYDKLSDEFKAEYIAGDGEGEYILDVGGLPEAEDTGPLKRALEAEKTKTKTLKAAHDALKVQIDEFPDIEALKAENEKQVGKYKNFTEKTLVENAALALATKISKSPALILPHIKSRLIADVSGDEPVTKILGADGKPSDLTIEKLGEEFLANKDFKDIMIGSRASGGGAPQLPIKPLGGGAPKDGEQSAPVDLSKLKGPELAAHITAKREARAAAAQQ